MNPTYDLIDKFSSLPSSHVLTCTTNPKQGFIIQNNELNMNLHIFSDKTSQVYFEFSPMRKDKTNYLALEYPTYAIENFQEAKPILERMMQLLDSNENIYNLLEQEYISLFRKLLRNESLPEGYSSGKSKHFLKIEKKSENLVLYIHMTDIELVSNDAQIASEPTTILSLPLRNQKYKDNPTFIYIPKYLIEAYPDLHKKFTSKNSNNLTNSFDSWIQKLQDTTDRERTAFNDLVDYILLEKTVASKDEHGTIKKTKI